MRASMLAINSGYKHCTCTRDIVPKRCTCVYSITCTHMIVQVDDAPDLLDDVITWRLLDVLAVDALDAVARHELALARTTCT